MVLRKRYRRDIRHNLSLYVSAAFITVLSLMLFYLYDICGNGILNYAHDIFESQKVEDANFSTYVDIPEEELEMYEEKYDLELEKQEYLNLKTDGVTSRVYEKTEKIDIPFITEGRDVQEDDEIVISEGYALNNHIEIGDTIKIQSKTYEVTGYVERPDYLVMYQNLGDAAKNLTSFYICYMTEDAFEDLGKANSQYLVRYTKDNNKEFRKDINDTYYLNSYIASQDNMRITMMTLQPEMFITMGYFTLFTLPLLAVVLIGIILSRKVRNEQKMIGTLAACGYTNRQIIRYYAGISAIPGIVGGLLTTLNVALLAQPYGELGLMDYEPLHIVFQLNVPSMIAGIIVPTLMYVLVTAYTVNKLLKHNVADLLAGTVKEKNKVRKSLVGKKVSIRKKLCVRSLLGNFGRTCVLLIGTFLGSFVVLWSFGCLDTAHSVSTVTAENMGHYNYQYVLNELSDENPYGGETLLAGSVEDEEERSLTIYGADDNDLIGLKDESGKEVDIESGYYVTSLYAMLQDLEAGDEMKLINPLSTKEYTVKVKGVVKNDYLKAIYTTRKNVSKISGLNETMFNVVVSKEKLDIPENKIITTVNRDSIGDQFEAAINQMNTVMYLFAGIGVVLCIIAVYIAVNMTVSENRKNISMLCVLGYSEKKIHKLLLHDSVYVVLFAFVLSIPCVIWATNALFRSFADLLGYNIEVYIKPMTYVYSFILTMAGYYISMYLVKRKVKKVDMVESLKDSRE